MSGAAYPKGVWRNLLVALIAVVAIFGFVNAAADTAAEDVDGVVEVVAGLNKNPFSIVTIGENTEVQLRVKNKGGSKLTVHSLSAQLTLPKDHSKILRNLTSSSVNVNIAAGKALNVTYKFKLDVEPQDLGLSVFVHWYNADESNVRSLGYRGVIKVSSNDSLFDLQSLFLAVLLLGGIGAAGYYSYNTYILGGKKTRKARAPKPTKEEAAAQAAAPQTVQDEWIPDHVKKQQEALAKQASSPQGTRRRRA
ncbi:hypothetical protein BJ742DRAFT_785105 [Cladochytrium replicatum]|nr:hypothetical protein BJ742DRAFT_785105 [Cladochytrium replicatum]